MFEASLHEVFFASSVGLFGGKLCLRGEVPVTLALHGSLSRSQCGPETLGDLKYKGLVCKSCRQKISKVGIL